MKIAPFSGDWTNLLARIGVDETQSALEYGARGFQPPATLCSMRRARYAALKPASSAARSVPASVSVKTRGGDRIRFGPEIRIIAPLS